VSWSLPGLSRPLLSKVFEDVPDLRDPRGGPSPLWRVLVIAQAAVSAGARTLLGQPAAPGPLAAVVDERLRRVNGKTALEVRSSQLLVRVAVARVAPTSITSGVFALMP